MTNVIERKDPRNQNKMVSLTDGGHDNGSSCQELPKSPLTNYAAKSNDSG